MAGRTFIAGRYGLGALIATDRFGEVYEAVQERLSRKVSIRLLPEKLATPEVVERFLANAAALSKLHHPNILFISEFGIHEGRPYLVRDVIEGETLDHAIERETRIGPKETAPVLLQIARALDYAHRAGVVHLDLQPSNILTTEGRIRVMELGLVRILEAEGTPLDRSIIQGSRYLAPEQTAGEPAGERADLYSLGVIGYRMLTGRFPYKQAKRAAVPVAELIEEPAAAKSLPSIVDRLLMKDPNERYPNAEEVVNALETAAKELELEGARPIDRSISVEAELIQAPDIEAWSVTTSAPGTEAAVEPATEAATSAPPQPPSMPEAPSLEDWVVPSSAPPAPRDIEVPEPSFWDRQKENVKIFVAALYLIGIAGATFYFAVGLPDAAAEVRGMIRRNQAAQVIPQLKAYVDRDPKLRAALGFAYVHVKDPKRAIAEYRTAFAKDPSVLDRADIAALVQLIGTTDPSTLDAEELLLSLGDRGKPKLRAAFDASSDPWFRCRVGDVLAKMGEPVDGRLGCRAVLARSSCSARRIAIGRLAELGDAEARPAIEALAAVKTSSTGEDCGYTEARAALSRWSR